MNNFLKSSGTTILLTLILSSTALASSAVKTSTAAKEVVKEAGKETVTEQEIDLSAPPYWMTDYAEFNDLRPTQKDFYLNKIHAELTKIEVFKNLKSSSLKEQSMEEDKWNGIAKTISQHCRQPENAKLCKKIADVRLNTFKQHANQKQDNRKEDKTE